MGVSPVLLARAIAKHNVGHELHSVDVGAESYAPTSLSHYRLDVNHNGDAVTLLVKRVDLGTSGSGCVLDGRATEDGLHHLLFDRRHLQVVR